jgi:hypothetical protein
MTDPRTPAGKGQPRFKFTDLFEIVDVERERLEIIARDYRKRAGEQATEAERDDWLKSADDRAWRGAGLAKVMQVIEWVSDPEIKARMAVLARDAAAREAALDAADDGEGDKDGSA